MCLTIPKKVLSIKKNVILVKTDTGQQPVGTLLPVKKGNWVLTQNGVIIKKITPQQAKEINKFIN